MEAPTERARNLRRNATDAERRLWQELRRRQVDGVKFRRQRPMGRYIADFVCVERRLVVEVDGGHDAGQPDYDETRHAWLRSQGYRVLRFSDREVLIEPESVVQAIALVLASGPPSLTSPASGGGDRVR